MITPDGREQVNDRRRILPDKLPVTRLCRESGPPDAELGVSGSDDPDLHRLAHLQSLLMFTTFIHDTTKLSEYTCQLSNGEIPSN